MVTKDDLDKQFEECQRLSEVIAEVRAMRLQAEQSKVNGSALPPPPDVAALVCVRDIEPEPIEWLWKPYIPLGKVTMLEGDPGVGKSWVSLAIATAVSLGRGLPGTEPTEPANVLVLNYEDGKADTIRPRLDNLGADVGRIFVANGFVVLDTGKQVTQESGLTLESLILECGARLVIVDPLVMLLGPNVDMHRANETRAAMTVLADIAERRKCAILCVRHLTKGSKDRSIYRGIGSVDFTAACRSVLLVGVDPQNHDRRAVVHIKSNIAEFGPSQGYEIREGSFFWAGESDLTAARILAPEPGGDSHAALEDAKDFLKQVLADGPVPAKQVFREAEEGGISEKTLRRAKAELGIRVKRLGTAGKRGGGGWAWELPRADLDGQTDLDGQREKLGHLNPFGHLNPPDTPQAPEKDGGLRF
jgi:hypothetical protein